MSRRIPLRNGTYAIAEYAAPQLGMLFLAPLLLHHLGAAQLGIWMLATAAVSSGALVAAGFGDGAVKYVATFRGRNDHQGIERVVRATLFINLCAGALLAIILFFLAPFLAMHMAHTDERLQHLCILSLRIGAVLLLLRSIEGVFTSTLRGLEQYATSSRITLATRLSILGAAALLALTSHGLFAIMMTTLVIVTLGVITQAIATFRVLSMKISCLIPSIDLPALALLAGYGCFTWLQVIAAILFSQADRILVGILLGPSAVAYYSICTQAAQPIHGLASAGFHALFPHLSARIEREPTTQLRSTILRAIRANTLLAVALTLPLALASRPLLHLWLGASAANILWLPLSILTLSYGLLSLNVTAHFTLLAFGDVRRVTWFNLAAAAATLVLMLAVTPCFGLAGAAFARLLYGPITLALYFSVFRHLHAQPRQEQATALPEAA